MKLKSLILANFRIFEQATFDFRPGMNLLVGINGTGKSSVLDALRMLLAKCVGLEGIQFAADDFTFGHNSLAGELYFTNDSLYRGWGTRHSVSDVGAPLVRTEVGWSGETREKTQGNPEKPVAVYFSPLRAFWADIAPKESPDWDSVDEQAAAYADALSPRRKLQAREFGEWMSAQKLLSRSDGDSRATRRLNILQGVVSQFLENYTRIEDGPRSTPTLLDQDENPLNIKQLSDGERDLLALIFDLMYYLSLANPKLDDPLRDGEAVVLIDELDLHLHPRWQRTVVENLTKTFPNCQFIATTHSPQIIGEVSPDNIILLERGKPPYRPDQALGMDSNWILRHLMGASERDSKTERELSRIAGSIEDEQYDKATAAIETLRSTLGEFPELVRLQTRIDRIRLLGE